MHRLCSKLFTLPPSHSKLILAAMTIPKHNLPKLAVKASEAQLRYPRVSKDHPSYTTFLQNTFKHSHQNKKALGLIDKRVIDQEFESQLRQVYADNQKGFQTHLQAVSNCSQTELLGWIILKITQMNSQASKSAWEHLRSRVPHASHNTEVILENVEQLKLAAVGGSIKARNGSGECWKLQKYDEFAKKTAKMNANVMFTKKLMDDAFRRAVTVAVSADRQSARYKSSTNVKAINHMLARVRSETERRRLSLT